MTPLEQRVADLERLVQSLIRVENLDFIKNAERRLNFLSGTFVISDAQDVNTNGAVSGQPLEYNGTQWVPGTDNT